MKHRKLAGLLVMATASLLAFTNSASAVPVLTSPAGTEYTGEIHVTMEPGTSSIMKAGIEDTCTATTVKGTVTTNNTTHASGAASVIANEKCTQDMKTITPGSLTINDAGEVFAFGNRIEIKVTSLGITCFYGGGESPGTKIGKLTTGSPAKLAVSTTEMRRLVGSNETFCATKGTWTGSFVVTTPSSLFLT